MNRAIPAAIITAVGLGALASFKSSSGLPTKSSSAVIVPRSTVPASTAPPKRSSSTSPRTTPTTASPATTPATSAPPATTPPTTTGRTRTLTGDSFDNRYGTVQVQVTLRGSQIVDVTALQMPDSHERSVEISQQAAPLLHDEVLQAQSAQIDILSGATYTSESYAQSLQSALDRANG